MGRRWPLCVLLGLWAIFASPLSHAHLLNMTKIIVSVQESGDLSVDMQVDLSRAAGGPLEYYQLSRVEQPMSDVQVARLMERLVGAVDLRVDGTAIPVQWTSIELPRLPREQFVDPLSWPMTRVVLRGKPAAPLRAAQTMQGVLRPSFPFEEPISLTFSLDKDQRSMTRWLVAGQSSPTFELREGAADGQLADDSVSLPQYAIFGFTHILPKGLDHVLFVLGLFLGARTFRTLLLLVTSFTIAHSITLALASVGAVRLPPDIVEPLIAMSIVWVGIENLLVRRGSAAECWRPLLVFGFGLLHGLGFASVLSELRLPADNFLLALLSFNLGIELGQLAVIGIAVAATLWFRHMSWYRSRIVLPVSLLIALVAIVWTVQRVGPQIGGGDAPVDLKPVTIKLVALNDFHGQLKPPGGVTRVPGPNSSDAADSIGLSTGGAAYLATLVGQLKALNQLNVVIAAGDLIGAAPLESALFHDEPSIEVLNAMGLEFSAIGNHEFDQGLDELRRIQNGGCHQGSAEDSCRRGRFTGASFKYLGANVVDTTTGKPVFPASAIKTFNTGEGQALKIGFIGAVLQGVPDIVVASAVRNLEFTDEASAANAAVPALQAQGADVIVLLIHEGGVTSAKRFDDTACPDFSGNIIPIVDRLDPAIAVVVSGHTHKTYICRRNGRLLTSAGSQGRFVTDIDLTIDRTSGQHVVKSSARQVAVVNGLAPNPAPGLFPTVAKNAEVDSIVSFYTSAAAPLTERVVAAIASDVTRETSPAGESALGDLIADAQLSATSGAAEGGAQVAFMNLAGIRADLLAHKGHVTYGEVHAVHPFGNAVTTMSLTGAQIHALLEQQWRTGSVLQISRGFTYEWSAAAPPGSKVKAQSIRLNGTVVNPNKLYRIAVNEFLADGGDGFKVFTEGTDRRRGIQDAEALEKYLAAHSPVKPPRPGRIRVSKTQ